MPLEINGVTLDDMTAAYLDAALWSSTGSDDTPLDQAYYFSDIPTEELQAAAKDCADFMCQAGDLLNDWSDDQAGHDFWLTRDHHGAGFWDRERGAIGDKLTALAHTFGERYLYVGDDGRIYGFKE